MKKALYFFYVFIALTVTHTPSSQGFLKKIKDKVNKTVDKAIGNEVEKRPAFLLNQSIIMVAVTPDLPANLLIKVAAD